MSRTHPWLDTRELPLLRATYPEQATPAELAAFLAVVEELVLELHVPYAWILDFGRSYLPVQAPLRRLYAASQKRLATHDRKYLVASALYCPNPIARGVIGTVYWLAPPSYPFRFFPTLDEATTWARTQLDCGRRAVGAA